MQLLNKSHYLKDKEEENVNLFWALVFKFMLWKKANISQNCNTIFKNLESLLLYFKFAFSILVISKGKERKIFNYQVKGKYVYSQFMK